MNGRSYTTTVSTKPDSRDSIRTGARVPVPTGPQSNQAASTVFTQYQYMDVGVNFDIHDVREVGRELGLSVKAEVTSLASSADSRLTQPVVRQNQWDSQVLLPVGKATPVFTSDAIDNKGSLQVVATVTRLE